MWEAGSEIESGIRDILTTIRHTCNPSFNPHFCQAGSCLADSSVNKTT